MPTIDVITAFALASLVLAATPGPDMLLVTSRAVAQGAAAGAACIIGFILGTYIHALLAAAGLAALAITSPLAFAAVTWAGAFYLLYLAVSAVSSKRRTLTSFNIRDATHGTIVKQGFLVNILNPKMFVFYVSFLPQFLDITRNVGLQILVLTTVMNIIGAIVNFSVSVVASRTGSVILASSRARMYFGWATGAVFLVLSLRLIIDGIVTAQR